MYIYKTCIKHIYIYNIYKIFLMYIAFVIFLYIAIYSSNKSQQDALFLKFILIKKLYML